LVIRVLVVCCVLLAAGPIGPAAATPPTTSPIVTPSTMAPSTSRAFTVQYTLTTSIGNGTWLTGVGLEGMAIQRNDTVVPTIVGSTVRCGFMSGSTIVSFQSAALAGAQPNSCILSTQGSWVQMRLQLAGALTLQSPEPVTVTVAQGLVSVQSSTGTRGAEAYSSSSGSYIDHGTTSYTVAAQNNAPAPAPGNDDFTNATVLQSGSTSIDGTTVSATTESGEWLNRPNATFNTVWYAWTAATDGSATFENCGTISNQDTIIAVFESGSLSSPLASNDEGCGSASTVTINATAGTTYYVQVSAYNASTVGAFTMRYPSPMVTASSGSSEVPLVVVIHRQSVPIPQSGTCTDVADADLAWGTGLSGGWQRAWQPWVSEIGGWACDRAIVKRGTAPWLVDNTVL
jgi:hypothetical protein